jgi:hypothetical protein
VTAVWNHCTLHTLETIEVDRYDSACENKKRKYKASGKDNENRKDTENQNQKDHGNRKENEVTNECRKENEKRIKNANSNKEMLGYFDSPLVPMSRDHPSGRANTIRPP